jgi:hypothetical protein
MVDGCGTPLALLISPANWHDSMLFEIPAERGTAHS